MRKALLLLTFSLSLSGCGTLITANDACYYSGFRFDSQFFSNSAGVKQLLMPFAMIDLPLSLLLDTLFLPVKFSRRHAGAVC